MTKTGEGKLTLADRIYTVIGKVGMTHYSEGLELKEIAKTVAALETNYAEVREKLIAEEKAFDNLEASTAPAPSQGEKGKDYWLGPLPGETVGSALANSGLIKPAPSQSALAAKLREPLQGLVDEIDAEMQKLRTLEVNEHPFVEFVAKGQAEAVVNKAIVNAANRIYLIIAESPSVSLKEKVEG